MKKAVLIGTIVLIAASFTTQAQATKSTGGVGNGNNASTIGSSSTTDPGSVGNDRTGRGQFNKSRTPSSSTINATADGTNGSATNDGASGQSGSPSPLPAFSTKPGESENSSRKIKKTTAHTGRTSTSSSDRLAHP